MLSKFLFLAVIGKILLYAIQIFPLIIKIKQLNSFLDRLLSCDFCLGFWVYFILDLFFKVWFEGLTFVPILSPFLMGGFIAFIVHLLSLGWRTKFEVIILE